MRLALVPLVTGERAVDRTAGSGDPHPIGRRILRRHREARCRRAGGERCADIACRSDVPLIGQIRTRCVYRDRGGLSADDGLGRHRHRHRRRLADGDSGRCTVDGPTAVSSYAHPVVCRRRRRDREIGARLSRQRRRGRAARAGVPLVGEARRIRGKRDLNIVGSLVDEAVRPRVPRGRHLTAAPGHRPRFDRRKRARTAVNQSENPVRYNPRIRSVLCLRSEAR